MRLINVAGQIPPQHVDAGAPPMLDWLRIDQLVIDDGYQRDITKDSWKRILRIASKFRWSRFSPVFVSPIEGGKYAIIDGQHRTHAAKLCGFETVPCQIVQMSREDQAASFAAVNGMVTKVTGYQILKAAMVAGERWALSASKICTDAGCKLMLTANTGKPRGPGEIYPISLIHRNETLGWGPMMTEALRALRLSRFGSRSEAYGNEILKPFFMAVHERPIAIKAKFDLVAFIDWFRWRGALDRAEQTIKANRRNGITGVPMHDLVSARIIEAIDQFRESGPVRESEAGDDSPPPPEPEEPEEGEEVAPEPKPVVRTAAPSPPPRFVAAGEPRFRLRDPEGRYANRFGTGFTENIEQAWAGTEEQAEAAMAMKAHLNGCKLVPAK